MKLIDDAERVLKRAWSVRMMVACFAVIIFEPIISGLAAFFIGQSLIVTLGLSALAGVFALLAILARITVQKDFS